MTKRHFEALAEHLRTGKPAFIAETKEHGEVVWQHACRTVADCCQVFNARFDRDKFLKACGY